MKENKFASTAQIILFPEQDIVTTSGGVSGGNEGVGGGPGIVLPDEEL